MSTTSADLESALLQWVNTFDLPRKSSALEDLVDGSVLWLILVNIDPDYFKGSLPEADRRPRDNWIPRWQNLKHIDRMVTTYIREECGKLPTLSKNMNPDLKSVAINGSADQTMKLVRTVLLASMYSPKSNQRMITAIEGLPTKVAITIAEAIRETEALDRKLTEMGADQESSSEIDNSPDDINMMGPSIERDPDLEREEQLIKANKLNQHLENQISRLNSELEERQVDIRNLEEELVEHKLQLDRREESRKLIENNTHGELQAQLEQDKAYIAELEADVERARHTLSSQEKQLDKLKNDSAIKQQLQDELQLITFERDELLQKAKANENLKKKIQTLQDAEKINLDLRQQVQSLNEQLREFDTLKERSLVLQKANEECSVTIANCEQEILDQKTARRRLEHEMRLISQKFDKEREQHQRALEWNKEQAEQIQRLEEQARDMDMGLGGSGRPSNRLADELNEDGSEAVDDTPKTATSFFGGDFASLQKRIEILQAKYDRMEERYLDVYQENLGLQDVVKEKEIAETNETTEASHPFIHQRDKLHATSAELQDLKSQFFTLEKENIELRDKVSKAPVNDDATVPQTEGDTQALRENHDLLISKHDKLEQYTKKLEAELEDRKSLLRAALRNPESTTDQSELRSSASYKLIRERLELVKSVYGAEDEEDVTTSIADSLAEDLITARKQSDGTNKRIQEQEAQIEALKLEVENAQNEAKKHASETLRLEVQNLQRETKLITSAWYDITSRLQSNTVVLQRKGEAPKSWIGRQRAAVGHGPTTPRRQ